MALSPLPRPHSFSLHYLSSRLEFVERLVRGVGGQLQRRQDVRRRGRTFPSSPVLVAIVVVVAPPAVLRRGGFQDVQRRPRVAPPCSERGAPESHDAGVGEALVRGRRRRRRSSISGSATTTTAAPASSSSSYPLPRRWWWRCVTVVAAPRPLGG